MLEPVGQQPTPPTDVTPEPRVAMETLRISNLVPGQMLEQSLFSQSGQKLVPAGTKLTQRHIDAMMRSGALKIIAAASAEELHQAGLLEKVDGKSLTVGEKSRHNVLSNTGQVVLEAGEEIESHHIDALNAGGDVFASNAKLSQQRREQVALADAKADELLQALSSMSLRVTSQAKVDWLDPKADHDWPSPADLSEFRLYHVHLLGQLYARIEAGIPVDVDEFDSIINPLMEKIKQSPQRFAQLALLCPRKENYLPDHCFTVTVLAIAMAAQLKWSEDYTKLLAQSGLLYDLGMLMVPERIRAGACELTDIDRARVQRHPVFSLAMMDNIDGVHPMCEIAALMHHERENGAGYPYGRRKDAICDMARVIAVADTYAATTEPRHYRKEKLPYVAMEETLNSTTALAFWKPAVRALLQAAGLFPVGSYVRLTSGDNAHVLAANPEMLDRPLIQPLNRDGKPEGPPINLAEVHKGVLSIARPVFGGTTS
jgi:HD-GYP domain-containing protein (c-di-GMP phosphodiesterase class II)